MLDPDPYKSTQIRIYGSYTIYNMSTSSPGKENATPLEVESKANAKKGLQI